MNDFYRKIIFFWPFLFLMSEFFHPFPLIWDYMKKIKIGYSHQKLYFWKVEILSFHMVYHTYIFIDFQNWPKIGSQCSQLSLEPVFCHIKYYKFNYFQIQKHLTFVPNMYFNFSNICHTSVEWPKSGYSALVSLFFFLFLFFVF